MSKPDDDGRHAAWSEIVDDDEEPQPQRHCVGCKTLAPPTRTAHTLISAKHGWRLQRAADHDGGVRMEWLCPECWNARRARSSESEKQLSPTSPRPEKLETAPATTSVSATGLPADMRTSGAFDMLSSFCKSLTTKLRSRARPGPMITRLLHAVAEIEIEIGTWAEHPPTTKRRTELWSALLSLNRETEVLVDPRK